MKKSKISNKEGLRQRDRTLWNPELSRSSITHLPCHRNGCKLLCWPSLLEITIQGYEGGTDVIYLQLCKNVRETVGSIYAHLLSRTLSPEALAFLFLLCSLLSSLSASGPVWLQHTQTHKHDRERMWICFNSQEVPIRFVALQRTLWTHATSPSSRISAPKLLCHSSHHLPNRPSTRMKSFYFCHTRAAF